MTFEEVVNYLHTLVGHRIEVSAAPDRTPGVVVELAGVVTNVEARPIGPEPASEYRYFCRVGAEVSNGFWVSPESFQSAGVGMFDPDTDALGITCQGSEGSYTIWIVDSRIEYKDGRFVLPSS